MYLIYLSLHNYQRIQDNTNIFIALSIYIACCDIFEYCLLYLDDIQLLFIMILLFI